MVPGWRVSEALLLLASHGFASAAPCSCVGAGALATDGQAHAVTMSTYAADVLKTLEGHALLTSEVTLDGEPFGGLSELLDVAILEVLDPNIRIHARLGDDGLGPS